MLKAYSYVEREHLGADFIDKVILEKEKRIIADFVMHNPCEKRETPCIVCSGATKDFATIDGVCYLRCSDCLSIFAPIDDEMLNSYRAYMPLTEFRNSDEYQNSITENRSVLWDDLLFWIEYRLARYMPNRTDYDIVDVRNRHFGLAERIKRSDFTRSYNASETGDVVIFFDQLRCQSNPIAALVELRAKLKDGGLLILNASVGSGFDVLTLKGGCRNIYPYEVIFLPSAEGLGIILEKAGFEALEISTPGTLDVENILENKGCLSQDDLFANYLFNKMDKSILAEFQRFLQKCGMSSHARVIAKKSPKGNIGL